MSFTPDAARGVAMLAERESAWNQVWHLPTAPDPPTGKALIAMAAKAFGVAPKYRVLSRPMLRVAGWFDPLVRESYEMLYQSEVPYLFDSTKFARELGFAGTPYPEGIRIAAVSYLGLRNSSCAETPRSRSAAASIPGTMNPRRSQRRMRMLLGEAAIRPGMRGHEHSRRHSS